jgi:exodeoxyribonuclease VII large subunit
LFPASLQGDQAEHSIIAQLNKIKKVQSHFDIVAIVRGGGGEVGMSCYNNYNLCKAIATFPLPVLTGIGHSTNLTVAEMVSYRNAITPTELGDFLIQAFHNFSLPLKDAAKTIKVQSIQAVEVNKLQLGRTSSSFSAAVRGALGQEKLILNGAKNEIKAGAKERIVFFKERISQVERSMVSQGKMSLQLQHAQLRRITEQLSLHIKSSLLKNKNTFEHAVQSIRLMNPINVLKRGFSITTLNGKTIGESNNVKNGDVVSTRTAKFTIESEVITTKKADE